MFRISFLFLVSDLKNQRYETRIRYSNITCPHPGHFIFYKSIKKYLDFLKVGGSKYPLDALKVADVDLTKKEVIEATCEEFNKLVNEFEKLYKEVYKKGSE